MATLPSPNSRRLADAAVAAPAYRTKFLLVYNIKGGVGKTAIGMNLGATVSVTIRPDRPKPSPVAVVSIDVQNTPQEYADSADRAGYRLPVDVYRMDRDPSKILNLDGKYRYVIIDAGGHLKGNNPLETILDLINPRTGKRLINGAIVPMEPWFDSRKPTAMTCDRILKSRGIPFFVVINKWPSTAKKELVSTEEFIDEHGWERPPLPIRLYRAYSKASETGLTVPDFDSATVREGGKADMLALASSIGLHTAEAEFGSDADEAELAGEANEDEYVDAMAGGA